MIFSMAGGPFHHQQIIIDLTKDEDDVELDEDDGEDDVGQADALMAAFGGQKSLKRKSSSDGTELRERPGSIHQVVVPAPPPANAINHGVTTKIQQHVKRQTTPKDEIKREPQIWIPRNELFPGLRRPNSPPPPPSRVRMISSRSSSAASASFSSSDPTRKPSQLHKPSNTSADSNSNSNSTSSKQGDRAQSTASMKSTSTKQRLQISVVMPPPPVKKKINRRPSISSDGASESDATDNKGVKRKYYPLDMYKIQADKGRYPKARHTNQNQIDLPLRLSPAQKNRPKSTHGKTLLVREMLERKLRAIQGPPVTMARDWDGRGSLASNFEFTNTYKLQKGVKRADQEFNYGCECGVHCDPQKCSCLSKEEDSEELMAVYEHRNGKLLLKESFLNRKTMIYECSSLCLCPPSCWNRLVQHGRKIQLEIFHTGNRGFGLRSPEFIHRGQFIDTYLGEVITSAEADARESANNNGSIQSHSYLFSLDWFADAGDQDEEEDDDDNDDEYRDEEHGNTSTIDSNKPFVVDGQRFGGVTRFMNHSCNPNCKLFAVSTHQGDRKIYDLAFFARRDIPPGTELTFDYNPNSGLEPKAIDPNAVKCLCGEARCRGQLWPTQTKSTST